MALLQKMDERFHFSWSCFFHPQLYSPELLELMYASGCHTIMIGIESADLSSLRRYKRRVSKENLENLLDKANQLNMNVCADFVLGLEHETEADVKNTIHYALTLPIDFASFNM